MTYYISITGLKLDSVFGYPTFIYHAIPSMMQAKRAPGNRKASARIVGPVHYTLTVWDDKLSMRRYILSGDHVQAMKRFDSFATGTTYGYESDVIPTWEEAIQLLHQEGRYFGKRTQPIESSSSTSVAQPVVVPPPQAVVKHQARVVVNVASVLLATLVLLTFSWMAKRASHTSIMLDDGSTWW